MIGLDTNVILRYITQDDPAQSRAATKLIESLSSEDPGFIPMIVVAELVWVLHKSYHAPRPDIARVLESLLQTKELVVERADLVAQALRQFSAGRAGFSDCLVERCADAAGCGYIVTFDQIAAAAAGMHLIR